MRIMKKITLILPLLLLTGSLLFGQRNQMLQNADSDPAARALLDKMRGKYERYSSMQAVFDLTIQFPEQPEEVQTVKVWQQDDRYRVEMNGRIIVSDGEALYLIMENNREVQINDIPDPGEDEGIFSPTALFEIYKRDDFVYALVNETQENGRTVSQIEFKPTDPDSDYFKLRLTLTKDGQEFVRLKSFGKDGTQYTLSAKELRPNAKLAPALFAFNKADYADYYVEDLRY